MGYVENNDTSTYKKPTNTSKIICGDKNRHSLSLVSPITAEIGQLYFVITSSRSYKKCNISLLFFSEFYLKYVIAQTFVPKTIANITAIVDEPV